jgi:phage baseplate assembly protein gpV
MGTLKRGIVVEGRGSQVRVQFDDNDGMISPWLDVAQESTIGKRSFRRFKAGEMVRCYIDRKGESGEALFAIYNDKNPAPADSDELFYEEAADGSKLEWGIGSFRYTNADGTIFEVSGGDVTITGNLKVSGDVTVGGKTDLQDATINDVPQIGS